MSILIKNGVVVNAVGTFAADVLVEGEHIVAVGSGRPLGRRRAGDRRGRRLRAARGADVHTHLDMPFGGTVSCDYFETGT